MWDDRKLTIISIVVGTFVIFFFGYIFGVLPYEHVLHELECSNTYDPPQTGC